jgi:hypothetical protein
MADKFHVVQTQVTDLAHNLSLVERACSQHVKAIEHLSNPAPAALRERLPFPSRFISGSGESETQTLALLGLSEFFVQVFTHFNAHGRELSELHRKIDQGDDKWRVEARSIITQLQQEYSTLSALADDGTLGHTKSQAPKKIAQLLAKGKVGKGDQKKLAKFVADATADRQKSETKSAQSQIMHVFITKMQCFKVLVDRIRPFCHTQRRILTETVSAFRETTERLAAAVQTSTAEFRESSRRLDFHADFTAFVRESKLIRYDLLCSPFKPIDVSHPVFVDIATKIQIAVPPIYPVGLAKVVRDHVSTASNQLSVTQGRYVLLMETIAEKWVYVSNPLTRVMGYVPKACVESVAPALAVVLRSPDPGQEVIMQCGDYVAVLEIGEGGDRALCKVITTKGEALTVPRDLLGVIYE